MSLYLDLKLSKEAEQQYNEIIECTDFSSYSKNIISDQYAEHLVRNHMSLKEKVSLMGMIRDNFRQHSTIVIEIQEAKHWFLRCMYNYYYKQYNNKFYEDIEVDELLKIAEKIKNIGQNISVEDLLTSLKNIKKEKVWQVINYLLAEGKLKSDKDGKISFQTKTSGI